MAGGDFSGCFEMTAAYGGYFRTLGGKYAVSWDFTGGSSERVIGKDPTIDLSSQVFHLEWATMSCASGAAGLYDGSGAQRLFGIMVSDVSPAGVATQSWDFRDDPLICLTADSTQSLCVSAANGHVCGFIKGFWGPKPA